MQSACASNKSSSPFKAASKATKIFKGKKTHPSRARPDRLRTSGWGSEPSASLGRAPDSAAGRPHPPPPSTQPHSAAFSGAAPRTELPAPTNEFLLPSVRLPPLELQAQTTFPSFPPTATNLFPHQWPTADPSVRLPLLAAQAQSAYFPPQPSLSFPVASQAPGAVPSVKLPPLSTSAPEFLPHNPLLQAKSQFSLFTASQMPIPPNAIAS